MANNSDTLTVKLGLRLSQLIGVVSMSHSLMLILVLMPMPVLILMSLLILMLMLIQHIQYNTYANADANVVAIIST